MARRAGGCDPISVLPGPKPFHGRVVMLVMLVNEHTLSAGEMGE
jgi:hypothetical protein